MANHSYDQQDYYSQRYGGLSSARKIGKGLRIDVSKETKPAAAQSVSNTDPLAVQNSLTLFGKRCVVIGGINGLGETISKVLAKEGASVVTLSRSEAESARADQVIRECAELGNGWHFQHIQCNVAERSSVIKAINQAASFLGGSIDLLFCGAGSYSFGSVATLSAEAFADDMATNFYGTVSACQAAFPYMKDNGGVILTCGIAPNNPPIARSAAYTCSKSAVQAFTRVIAKEWSEYNIRCNCIVDFPGTNMHEQINPQSDFVITSEDITNYVLFLAGDQASRITGQSISINS